MALIALLYIKLYQDNKDDLSLNEDILLKINDLHDSARTLGSIPGKVSAVIRNKFVSLLQ